MGFAMWCVGGGGYDVIGVGLDDGIRFILVGGGGCVAEWVGMGGFSVEVVVGVGVGGRTEFVVGCDGGFVVKGVVGDLGKGVGGVDVVGFSDGDGAGGDVVGGLGDASVGVYDVGARLCVVGGFGNVGMFLGFNGAAGGVVGCMGGVSEGVCVACGSEVVIGGGFFGEDVVVMVGNGD